LQIAFHLRHKRLGVVEQRQRFLHVQLGRHTVIEPDLRDIGCLLLQLDIALRDTKGFLQGADIDVDRSNIPGQRHQRVIIIGDLRGEVGLGRLHTAALRAPDIGLPFCIKADLVGGEIRIKRHHLANFANGVQIFANHAS
jgi:hypothetical protein